MCLPEPNFKKQYVVIFLCCLGGIYLLYIEKRPTSEERLNGISQRLTDLLTPFNSDIRLVFAKLSVPNWGDYSVFF